MPKKKKAASQRENSYSWKHLALRGSFYLLLAAIVVFNLFPFCCALFGSFRPSNALFSTNLSLKALNFDNYLQVFDHPIFVQSLINSFVAAGATAIISLTLGSLCAYALGRLPFRFKRHLLYLVLLVSHFPAISMLAGFFVMLRTLSLFNSAFPQPIKGPRGSCLRRWGISFSRILADPVTAGDARSDFDGTPDLHRCVQ
jgi:ABC-type glycerol-3-phosphate transport system permease component